MPRRISPIRTILIVHDDLGILLALSLELQNRGIGLVPANTVLTARRLLREMGLQLDVAVMGCRVRGVCELAAALVKRSRGLKIVGVVSKNHRCSRCKELFCSVLEDGDAPWIPRWASLIERVSERSFAAH